MKKNILEFARLKGKCSDRIYNQINNCTVFENYKNQKQKIKEEAEKKVERENLIVEHLPKELEKQLKQIMR